MVFQVVQLAFFMLQGWNHSDYGSTTFVSCVVIEGLILIFLLFHSGSTLIIKGVEGWVRSKDQGAASTSEFTSEEMIRSLSDRSLYHDSNGVFIALGAVSAGIVVYFVKLAGYATAFGYAR